MTEIRTLINREVKADVTTLVKTLAEQHELLTHKVLYLSSKSVEEIDRPIGVICAQAKALLEPIEDYEAAARDAGYDGSPGGEKEWCQGNEIEPCVYEIAELWIVSPWLGSALKTRGERVDCDLAGLTIWARPRSEALIDDPTLIAIASERSSARV